MGKIEIKIQTEERMKAISYLSEALRDTARALSATPQVNISNCHIEASDVGINIESLSEENTETIIHEVE